MLRENTADFPAKRVNVLNSGPVMTKKGNSLDTKVQPAVAPPTLNASGGNFNRSALSPTNAEGYQVQGASYELIQKKKSNMSDFESQVANEALLSQRNNNQRYAGHMKNPANKLNWKWPPDFLTFCTFVTFFIKYYNFWYLYISNNHNL